MSRHTAGLVVAFLLGAGAARAGEVIHEGVRVRFELVRVPAGPEEPVVEGVGGSAAGIHRVLLDREHGRYFGYTVHVSALARRAVTGSGSGPLAREWREQAGRLARRDGRCFRRRSSIRQPVEVDAGEPLLFESLSNPARGESLHDRIRRRALRSPSAQGTARRVAADGESCSSRDAAGLAAAASGKASRSRDHVSGFSSRQEAILEADGAVDERRLGEPVHGPPRRTSSGEGARSHRPPGALATSCRRGPRSRSWFARHVVLDRLVHCTGASGGARGPGWPPVEGRSRWPVYSFAAGGTPDADDRRAQATRASNRRMSPCAR